MPHSREQIAPCLAAVGVVHRGRSHLKFAPPVILRRQQPCRAIVGCRLGVRVRPVSSARWRRNPIQDARCFEQGTTIAPPSKNTPSVGLHGLLALLQRERRETDFNWTVVRAFETCSALTDREVSPIAHVSPQASRGQELASKSSLKCIARLHQIDVSLIDCLLLLAGKS